LWNVIERIEIAGCASYSDSAEIMNALREFNFVYGPNGSGKTTISRMVADYRPYTTCAVHWHAGTKLETMVYNRDFVDANFNQPTGLKGIYERRSKNRPQHAA
jgi:ABC-type iron transport system FetAB ATPase subunit